MKRNLLGLVGLGLWPIQNADARHYPALRRTLVATEFVKSQKLIGLYGFCQICFLSYKPTNMVTNSKWFPWPRLFWLPHNGNKTPLPFVNFSYVVSEKKIYNDSKLISHPVSRHGKYNKNIQSGYNKPKCIIVHVHDVGTDLINSRWKILSSENVICSIHMQET